MTSKTTRYSVQVNGETVSTKTTRATQVAAADALRSSGERGLIEVVTGSGKVVHTLPLIKTRVLSYLTKPYTKTIELPEALATTLPEGYVTAYVRPRNATVVGRNMQAEKDERYVVVRAGSDEILGYASTTRDAGALQAESKVAKSVDA